jgi:hypothetical protein
MMVLVVTSRPVLQPACMHVSSIIIMILCPAAWQLPYAMLMLAMTTVLDLG